MASESSAKPALDETSSPEQSKNPTLKHKFEGHEKTIWCFVCLHDNVHIVSGSLDGTMRKWDCNTGLLVGEPWNGDGGRIWSVALSPDGKMIACGREDGSVQRWNIDGKMVEGFWTSDNGRVRSLSWSPSGEHIASGSFGAILIRKAESGQADPGPIQTKHGWVYALTYSPSGDRIASGGDTICIWDVKTGELVVGPIQDLSWSVRSLVWSSDDTKLYSASGTFARAFDSGSGSLLHRFEHNGFVNSIALSPANNVLACVGNQGIAQLWDTESQQPLGQSLRQDHQTLRCVSFSRDGIYMTYGGNAKKLTLWVVDTQQEPQPKSTSSPSKSPDVNTTDLLEGDGDWGGDTYGGGFFQSSQPHNPPLHRHHVSSARRLLNSLTPSRPHWNVRVPPRPSWNVFIPSRRRPSADVSVQGGRPKRRFFAHFAHPNSPLQSETTALNQPTPEAIAGAAAEDEQIDHDGNCSANDLLGTSKQEKGKGKQRDEPPADAHTPLPNDPASPERNLRKRPMHALEPSSSRIAPEMKQPKVVEVSAVRAFQRIIVWTPKHKTRDVPVTALVDGSSQPGSSSHVGPAGVGASLQLVSGQPGPAMVGNGAGHPSSYPPPSHFVNHTSRDSDSIEIQGSCNKFLDKICYPCGHYY